MDTDDLTAMAHDTIAMAYDVFEPLRSEIGASASEFRTEDDFLKGILTHLAEILDDPDEYLDFWNSLDSINRAEFLAGLRKIRQHARRTLKTPLADRGPAGIE